MGGEQRQRWSPAEGADKIIQRIMQPMVGVMGWEGYSVLTLYHKGSYSNPQFSSVQLLNRVRLFVTPWNAACQAFLSITNSWSLLKLMSIEWVMPSNHLILSSPSPPAFSLSQHQSLFQRVSSSHQMAKVLELQLQHQSSQWIFSTDFL